MTRRQQTMVRTTTEYSEISRIRIRCYHMFYVRNTSCFGPEEGRNLSVCTSKIPVSKETRRTLTSHVTRKRKTGPDNKIITNAT